MRRQRAADTPISAGAFESAPPPPPYGHPDLVLAEAVAAGVITTAEAQLIGATRLDGVSTEVMAARLGTSVDGVRKRRVRAEGRLVAVLRERLADLDCEADPTFTAALATLPMSTGRTTRRSKGLENADPLPSYPQRDFQARLRQPGYTHVDDDASSPLPHSDGGQLPVGRVRVPAR